MTSTIEFQPDPEDFIFTSWSHYDQLVAFRDNHVKDLQDHDKCGRCGVWVITQCIEASTTYPLVSVWQCPSCKATDTYY